MEKLGKIWSAKLDLNKTLKEVYQLSHEFLVQHECMVVLLKMVWTLVDVILHELLGSDGPRWARVSSTAGSQNKQCQMMLLFLELGLRSPELLRRSELLHELHDLGVQGLCSLHVLLHIKMYIVYMYNNICNSNLLYKVGEDFLDILKMSST